METIQRGKEEEASLKKSHGAISPRVLAEESSHEDWKITCSRVAFRVAGLRWYIDRGACYCTEYVTMYVSELFYCAATTGQL